MADALTSAQRSLRARMAAHAQHSQHDSRDITAPARAASPASVEYFYSQVDPTSELSEVERHRRAEQARRAYFTGLALRSSRARSKAAS